MPLDVSRVQLVQRRTAVPRAILCCSWLQLCLCRVVSEQCLQLVVACYHTYCERAVTKQLGGFCSDVCFRSAEDFVLGGRHLTIEFKNWCNCVYIGSVFNFT
jgi:hypothetical protein